MSTNLNGDMTNEKRMLNFSPGPAKLPEQVLMKAQKDMINYEDSGVSVMELSHRSKDFNNIIDKTEENLRELLEIPDTFRVLFLQGGGTGQFAAVACNLMGLQPKGSADYIVTGSWSAKAAQEAEKYGKVNYVVPKTKKYTDIPDQSEWNLDPEASYVYYCDNETIHGLEFQFVPETNGVPLVCDMSSNILTRKIDFSKFGLIYAGAQKNIGCAGCTLVLIRDDLIGKALPSTPTVFCYQTMVGHNSLYNTPPTYSIYIMGLVFEWIKEQGGVETMEANSKKKSERIYKIVDTSSGFFSCPIAKSCRSRMNLTFRISCQEGCDILEKKFIDLAAEQGMIQLKGHRSVGGIRVSLYNAVTIDETETLALFMEDFLAKHRN